MIIQFFYLSGWALSTLISPGTVSLAFHYRLLMQTFYIFISLTASCRDLEKMGSRWSRHISGVELAAVRVQGMRVRSVAVVQRRVEVVEHAACHDQIDLLLSEELAHFHPEPPR